jgi:hypothetical protein
MSMEGQCLCGEVRVTVPASIKDVGVCHCRMCRRWGSGPWMSIQAPSDTQIDGANLKVFRSSWAAERGFCGRCGSHIFHRPQDGPELAVSVGLFDEEHFHIGREICHDAKPPYYRFEADGERSSSAVLAVEWLPRLVWRRLLRTFRRRGS